MSLSPTVSAITGQIDYSSAIHVFPNFLQPWRPTFLAYSASLISTAMGFPLDTIKTRMQTHKHFASYFDCIKKTYLKEGTMGFIRGMWAPLLLTSFSKSVNVLIFTKAKPVIYSALYGTNFNPSSTHPLILNAPVSMLTGFLAGGGFSIVVCPFTKCD